MQKNHNDTTLQVNGYLFILLALAFLLLPVRWVVSWCFACAFHEWAHYLALRLCGQDVYRIRLGAGGAVMQIGELKPWQEVVCAMAGPCAGFLLILVARWFPRLALCGAFQSIYNLLPVFPLDGGRVMRCFLCAILTGAKGERIAGFIEIAIKIALIGAAAACAVFLDIGVLPLIMILSAILRNKTRKMTCKAGG